MSQTSNIEVQHPPVVLTIAGLDPSGGAGVIADVRTFSAFGCFPTAAITSLTFQNTTGVSGATHQTAEVVRAQVLPIIADFRVAALKTGMLPTREVIVEVARLLRETELRTVPAVIDPVLRSTSGYDLIADDALTALRRELLPHARVVTPNISEAERLTNLRDITDEAGMRAAASLIRRETGARAVLIKGGHLAGDALDLLDDAGTINVFRAPRIETTATHGTGCTLAAAIAACLARGLSLPAAIETAKRFVTAAIRRAPQLGRGTAPINHTVPVRFTQAGVFVADELDEKKT
ncbi:MAG: bifunctional hydroxymethylpyrimidine kinase/phosphomethylpyrimidine kinase [Acidobacteria bacterium]|nr:MAG: bifunctional hydroxymethylpyrimidine kinase/phosphomethylpyrimidine kinase [Acidobacteriota bacterium]